MFEAHLVKREAREIRVEGRNTNDKPGVEPTGGGNRRSLVSPLPLKLWSWPFQSWTVASMPTGLRGRHHGCAAFLFESDW